MTCQYIAYGILSHQAQKNKLYVSKLPRAFVIRCVVDSAKFKLLIFLFFFFTCLIFFQFFMSLLVKIYMKRHDRHFEQQISSTLVFCLVFCSSKNQVPYFILIKAVTDSNLTRLLLEGGEPNLLKTVKKKKTHTHTFRSGLPICHKLWDIELFKKKFSLIYLIQEWWR